MQQKSFFSINPQGFHKVAYVEWGAATANTILCVHGLTRNGRDFDDLAQSLANNNLRVACPDLVGRGASDRLSNAHFYNHLQYVADMTAMIARLNVNSLIWIGTSLGGLLGMYLAAQNNTPIKALILNDVGPVVSKIGLSRINKYSKNPPKFNSLADAESYLRHAYNSTENISDAQWRAKTEHSMILLEDGQYTLDYDPAVANSLRRFWITDINLWSLWNKIKCPILVLHGEKSDILLPDTVKQMRSAGPKTTVYDIPGCGHTPMLMTIDQISLIQDWITRAADI